MPAAKHAGSVDHAAWGPVTAEDATGVMRSAAANLTASQQLVPAVTHHDRADLCAIDDFRSRLRAHSAECDTLLTSLAFHVRALAATLGRFPECNVSLSADGRTLWRKHHVHIGIVVDAPHGLVVPVIRDANRKGIHVLASEIAELASRARERWVRPEDLRGASMSISSLGGTGGLGFTPMINPPEAGDPGNQQAGSRAGLGRDRIPATPDGSARLHLRPSGHQRGGRGPLHGAIPKLHRGSCANLARALKRSRRALPSCRAVDMRAIGSWPITSARIGRTHARPHGIAFRRPLLFR